MKAKEAQAYLKSREGNIPDTLFQDGGRLFFDEAISRIALRSYNKPPSRLLVEGVLSEMVIWFRKATETLTGVNWVDMVIESRTGEIWLHCKLLDPRLEELRKRTRFEMLRGSPFPMFTALTKESLDAAASMMIAKMRQDFSRIDVDRVHEE